MDRTLAIVKPNAVQKNKVGAIVASLEDAGLKVVALRMTHITQAQAEGFYAVHRDKGFFAELVEFMSSGPIVPMVLEGKGAVERARKVMGATDPKKAEPGTIRARFGDDVGKNAVHGSDSLENAAIEIAFFFPSFELVPPAHG